MWVPSKARSPQWLRRQLFTDLLLKREASELMKTAERSESKCQLGGLSSAGGVQRRRDQLQGAEPHFPPLLDLFARVDPKTLLETGRGQLLAR
jgi:hypothetical protein